MHTRQIDDLIQQLNDLYDGDLWLGENFKNKLAQVNETLAFSRPLPEMHSPAELLSHLIEWRRVNVRRLKGEALFPGEGDPLNWRANDELRSAGWHYLLDAFEASRREVTALLGGKDDSYLDMTTTYHGKTARHLLQGLIHHDLYHLGQLGISIKYLKLS